MAEQQTLNLRVLGSIPRRLTTIQVTTALAAIALALLAFVYRFDALGGARGGFDDDQFAHLVRATHLLRGELPLRDFADAELRAVWPPLTYMTSAAAQAILGPSLRSEALLAVGLLAAGAGLTLWLAADVSGSLGAAVIVAFAAVALGPKLYNYPKIICYGLAVLAMLAYARRPGRRGLIALGLTTAVGALYRHDHGVFLSIASIVAVLLVRPPHPARALATFVLTATLALLPGLVFVQSQVGLLTYLRDCLEVSRQESRRTTAQVTPPTFDRTQPWQRTVAAEPAQPRIKIRWAQTVNDQERTERERALGLVRPIAGSDARNWSYDLPDWSPPALRAIVTDPRVEDTDGIDRVRFRISAPEFSVWWARLYRAMPLLRWRPVPGLIHAGNAVPWLFFVAWLIVVAGLFCSLVPAAAAVCLTPGVPRAAVGAVATLGLLLLVVYLRNPVTTRLPDVSVPVAILGAWLLATSLRVVRHVALPLRLTVHGVLTVVVTLTLVAAVSAGAVAQEVSGFALAEGPRGAWKHWARVWTTLGALPDSIAADPSPFGRGIAYLRRCTSTSDRVLVGDNAPDISYFAGRGFAAGQLAFFSNFYSAQADQRVALRRWRAQSVPVALVQPADRFDEEFGADYPLLAAYLRFEYHNAGRLDFGGGRVFDVWVRTARPATFDAVTGLPCFPAVH